MNDTPIDDSGDVIEQKMIEVFGPLIETMDQDDIDLLFTYYGAQHLDGRYFLYSSEGPEKEINPRHIMRPKVRLYWTAICDTFGVLSEAIAQGVPDSMLEQVGGVRSTMRRLKRAIADGDQQQVDTLLAELEQDQAELVEHTQPAVRQAAGRIKTKRINWQNDAMAMQTDIKRLEKGGRLKPASIQAKMQEKYNIKRTRYFEWKRYKP